MADWNLPLLTSSYTQFLTDLKDRDADSLTMLDGATPANLPVKAKRWNDANQQFETWDGTTWTPMVLGLSGGGTGATTAAQARSNIAAAAASHTHTIANVTNLQATLDGKAPASHTHTIANVANLQATLDGKAAASHTHTIAQVTGLQAALDGKAPTVHAHTVADVTGLQAALNGRASLSGANYTGPIIVTVVQGWEAGGHAYEAVASGGGPALITFHRPSAFAAKLGLDTDNQLKWGGWSYGSARHRIWHDGVAAVSLAQNGYQRLPSGIVVQWGRVLMTASNNVDYSGALVFPLAFPTAVLACSIGGASDQAGDGRLLGPVAMGGLSRTGSSLGARCISPAALPNIHVNYVAIGY